MVTAYILRFIVNLKNSLNKEGINLGRKGTTEKLFEERLWAIYVQKDIFSSKQYEQLKNDLVFYYCRLNYQMQGPVWKHLFILRDHTSYIFTKMLF